MPWEAITTVAVVCGVLLSALIQYSGKSQWQGEVGQRLNGHDEAIKELKGTNQLQWSAINEHSTDIAALKAGARRPNGHHGTI